MVRNAFADAVLQARITNGQPLCNNHSTDCKVYLILAMLFFRDRDVNYGVHEIGRVSWRKLLRH